MKYNEKQYTVTLNTKGGTFNLTEADNGPLIDLIQSARMGKDLVFKQNGLKKIPFDAVNSLKYAEATAKEVDKGEGFCVD